MAGIFRPGTAILRQMQAALLTLALSFTRLASDGPAPGPRVDGAIAYDARSRQVFLFGGLAGTARNDLWAYSLDRNQWTEMRASGGPPARFGHTLILDPIRRRLVIFGGQAGGFFNDTWAFAIDSGSWQLLSPGGGPSKRYGHSAIYDAAGERMIVSHGFTDEGRFDDTWAYDLRNGAWRNLTPAGDKPLRRCLHHAVYDPGGNQMLLYGGCSSGFGPCPQGDLWAFDLTRNVWTQRTAAVMPPARQWWGGEFDAAHGQFVVFSGATADGLRNDLWAYDPRSNAWQQQTAPGEVPEPRQRHETAYAGDLQALFFFGGRTASADTNELWMLSTRPAAHFQNLFSGDGTALSPGELVALSPASGQATFGGIAATPLRLDPDQAVFQVPESLIPGAAEIRLSAGERLAATVVNAHPGLYPVAFHPDGTPVSPDRPSTAGSAIVLFVTGHGVSPAAARVSIGGRDAEVLYQGPSPGSIGVLQLNLRLPEALAGDAVPVRVRIGESDASNVLTIQVN